MTCRQVQRIADEIASGAAEPAAGELARQHARACEACALVLDRAEALRELLALDRAPATAPPGLAAAVRERIESRRLRPSVWLGWRARVTGPVGRLAVCGAIAVAALAIALHPRGPEATAPGGPLTAPARVASRIEPAEARGTLEALRSAADSNQAPDVFTDSNVIELAQNQAGGLATSCLDL